MRNSSFAAESGGSPPPSPAFCRWEIPGRLLQVQLSLELIERLEREVLDRLKDVTARGAEIGGVLLGRIDAEAANRTVTVEDCELVPCDYARSPLYLLGDRDRERLRHTVARRSLENQRLSVVGFFRSNTRRDLAVDEEDLDVLHEYVAGRDCLFLLVKPYASRPGIGAWFLWSGEGFNSQPELQFPFRRSELEKVAGHESKPVEEVRPPEPPPSVEARVAEPPAEPEDHFSWTPAPDGNARGVRIRILHPSAPVLLVDAQMREEWDAAAATRTGKLREHLLRLKQCFCDHPNLLWIENVPDGDKRGSVWQCTGCRAVVRRETRQPYGCEDGVDGSARFPPGALDPDGGSGRE